MNISILFLIGLDFGIIIYLLFKVNNFKKKVKNFLEEDLNKNEKILKLVSTLKRVELESKEFKVILEQLVNLKEELIKENESLKNQLKSLKDEILKTQVTKKEVTEIEEKSVNETVKKPRRKKIII